MNRAAPRPNHAIAPPAQEPLVRGEGVGIIFHEQRGVAHGQSDARALQNAPVGVGAVIFTKARTMSVSVMIPISWPPSNTGTAPILWSSMS
jgi:hypothetical protein